jgi:lipopolysaccharide export system protein LptC
MTWAVTKAVIVISLLFFTGLLWWLPSQLIEPAMQIAGSERNDPDYFIENFTVTAMDERGDPRYKLSAKRLVHYPNDQRTRLERPRLTQFTDDTVTTADRGFISGDGKALLMSGNVNVTRPHGDGNTGAEIKTNELNVFLD